MKKITFLLLFLLGIVLLSGWSLWGKDDPTGEEIYKANCQKCHYERYASERTDAEWKVIMTHMRVRAGLTAKETKLVLQYLQENNPEE